MTARAGQIRGIGARASRAGAALLLISWVGMGCAAQMRKTETRLDEISADTRAVRAQQTELSGEVTRVRSLLESSGMVSDEQRAELLTRLRSLEQAVEQLGARGQEQEAMLRRMSAALDQLTRQAGLGDPAAAPVGDIAPPSGAQTPVGGSDSKGSQAAGNAGSGAANSAPSTAPVGGSPPPSGTAQPGQSRAATTPSEPAGSGSPELVVYDAAMRDFTRGSYALARDGFDEVVRRFPKSELADNAAYWLGETFYAEAQYAEALARFDQVLQAYPTGDILPSALLKTGYCQLELGDRQAAIAAFQRLRREYPSSDEAAIAEHKLNAIGSRP